MPTVDDALWLDRLLLDLDRYGPVPLYHQIACRLEAAIRSGEVPAGTRLVNEIELGKRLHIARGTVRHAMQELSNKGLIVKRAGAGTRVLHVT